MHAAIYRDVPHVVSCNISRFIGRGTIRESLAQVSRCIDASMPRYTPSCYSIVFIAAITPTNYSVSYIVKNSTQQTPCMI